MDMLLYAILNNKIKNSGGSCGEITPKKLENTDLNTVTETGFYYGFEGHGCTNTPENARDTDFSMIVVNGDGIVYQIFTRHRDIPEHRLFQRSIDITDSNDLFVCEWAEFATTEDCAVDSVLSETSTRPPQNAIVTKRLNEIESNSAKKTDISGKQDKLTAGTNITISGNTISAKDTTYNDATQSTHGLMTAADKKKLDGMDLSKYLPKDGTAKKAELLSSGQMRSAYCYNDDATFSNGYVWFKIGTATLSGGYDTVATTFLGVCGYAKHALYTCCVRLTSTGNAVGSMKFFESGRTGGMPTGLFRIVAISGEKDVTFELWAKGASRWEGTKIVILNEMWLDGSGRSNFWTLTSRDNADAKLAPTSGNMYVDSSDSSTCATATKATEATTLTDSGWIDTTRNISFTEISTVQCRKYGQLVEVRGEVTFRGTYGSPVVCTLPDEYCPATEVHACGITPNGKQYMIDTGPSGIISFKSDSESTFVKDTTYSVDLTYLLG